MHEITNLTNSPYELQTLDGPVTLPARGAVKAKFDPAYLDALRGVGMYEVREVPASKAKKS